MPKNNNHKKKRNGAGPRSIRVQFTHPTASAVAIVGTFNDWRPKATEMIPVGEGRWLKELTLAPGTYEYLFVADGAWVPDPAATHTVPNPFGGVNCLLHVAAP